MARHYNLKTLIRQTSKDLLERYFKQHSVLADFDFKSLKPSNPDPLFTAWLSLPEGKRHKMEAELQEVFAMSNEKGFKAIIDEARFWIETKENQSLEPFVDWLSKLKNHYDRALSVFLRHRDYWRGATNFYHADSLPYWRKRKGLPKVTAQCDGASLEELATRIGNYFHNTEGKGRNCIVEPFRRNNLDYFFAYPEDYSQRSLEWVSNIFQPRSHKPAFEVVFIYSEKEGSLDLNYRGNYKAVEPLQGFFCESILKQALPPETENNKVYDLAPFLQSDFMFKYDPGSGIEAIHITKLRLSSRIHKDERIILEVGNKKKPDAVYDLLARELKLQSLKQYVITQVGVTASISTDPEKPSKSVSFTITHPNSCSLKYDDIGMMLRGMLERSGIEAKELDSKEGENQ